MKHKRKALNCFGILISLVLLLSNSSHIQAQQKLSLNDAIKTSLENNYQIQISKNDLEIAKNNDAWGTVGALPSLSLSASQTNSFTDDNTGEYYTHGFIPGVNLRWTIFNGFSARINKQKMEDLYAISEEYSAVIVENTLQAVILAYYNVKLQEEIMALIEKVLSLSRDRYIYEEERKKLGMAVTYDLLQAKNAYLTDSSNYVQQKYAYDDAFRNLKLLMAEKEKTDYVLTDSLKLVFHDFAYEGLENKMLSNNHTLKNQYLNLSMLKKESRVKKSAYYPSLSLNSGYNHSDIKIDYSGLPAVNSSAYDFYVNFSLSYNIFNGRNTRRAIENAVIDEKSGEIALEEKTHSLRNELISEYDLYLLRHQLYEVAVANMESASVNLELSKERFRAGVINSFNYRDVQLLWLNTAISKSQAAFNLISSHTNLLRLSGGILTEY